MSEREPLSRDIVVNGIEFHADLDSEDARKALFIAAMSVLALSPRFLTAIDAVLGEGAWLKLFGDGDGYEMFQAANLIGSLVSVAGLEDVAASGE